MKLYCDNCEMTFETENDNRFYELTHDGLYHCPKCGHDLEEVETEDSTDEDEESDSDEE